MLTVELIAVLVCLCASDTSGRLLWERSRCAPDPEEAMPEGLTWIGRFPWLGVIQHSFMIGDQHRFAVTTGVLIHPSYVIAPADDIAKIRPEALLNNTKFIVWFNSTIKYSLDVLDYSLHPDYAEGRTRAAIALLEVEGRGVVGVTGVSTPILPVCMNLEGVVPMTDLYAVRMNDNKGELYKEIYKMDFVDEKDCEEFYYRAKLTYTKMKPTRHFCAVSSKQKESCVWDAGVALITRQAWGYWKLLGFSPRGPGCGAPTRFIFLAPFLPWIDEVISITDLLEEEDEEVKIYFRRLAPMKLQMYKGDVKLPKQHGQCEKKTRGNVLFKDSSELLVNKNFVQGFYIASVMMIAQFTCAVLDLNAQSRTNAAVWLEHHCAREVTGLSPGQNEGPDFRKLECFSYFKTNAFIEFRFYFSFKLNIEMTFYGREDVPLFIANPFISTETTEIWSPTDDYLRWGNFNPYYISPWRL